MRYVKSVTWRVELGSLLDVIPVTVVTPAITTWVVPTLTTLAIIGSGTDVSVNLTRLSTDIVPGKNSFDERIELNPVGTSIALIVAIPIVDVGVCITSAVKEFAAPTHLKEWVFGTKFVDRGAYQSKCEEIGQSPHATKQNPISAHQRSILKN